DDLVRGRVAARLPHPHARRDLAIAIDDDDALALAEQLPVVLDVARLAEVALGARVLELALLDDELRVREAQPPLGGRTVGRDEAAYVVEVHVRDDDLGDVLGPHAGLGEPGLDPGTLADVEHRLELRIAPPWPDPALDENPSAVRRAD